MTKRSKKMKILVMGDRKRYEKYAPQMNIIEKSEIIYIARDACTAAALEAAPDAGILSQMPSPGGRRPVKADEESENGSF